MQTPLRMRELTEEEERVIKKLAHSRTASARLEEFVVHGKVTLMKLCILLFNDQQ